jgi:hypothetical protein
MVLESWPIAMLRNPHLLLIVLVVVVVLANVWLIAFTLGRPPATPPLPNPNGYDDLVKAAGLVTGDVFNADALDHEELRALVATNTESLRLLRLGLTRQCALPHDSVLAIGPGMADHVKALYRLANLLEAEGRLREIDDRRGDALQSYVDSIRLGSEMSRGGFVAHRLTGCACEADGCIRLSRLAPTLDPKEARWVIAELEKIDSATVPWEEVRRNEFGFHQYQVRNSLNPFKSAMIRWQGRHPIKVAEMRHNKLAAHLRLLTAELALRCYRSEQLRAPSNLGQLVPKYLQRVPTDSFTGRPMIYRLQGASWLLYSVGEDGVDDGGDPVARSVAGAVTKGDLYCNSPY